MVSDKILINEKVNESLSQVSLNRLRKILISDKLNSPARLLGVLKSDIFDLLKNYMDITEDNIKLNINIDERGMYNISISASAKRMKVSSILPK